MGCVYIAARCSWPQGWQPQSCKESKGWKVGVGTEGCAGKEKGVRWCEEEIKSALSFTCGPIKSDAQPLSVSIFVSVLVFVEPFHLSTGVQPQDSPDLGGIYKGKGQNKHLKFLSWDFEAAHVNCMKMKLIVDITVHGAEAQTVASQLHVYLQLSVLCLQALPVLAWLLSRHSSYLVVPRHEC